MSLDMARRVADAVLYEGYVLYPYRASAQKNRLRWQFGVLVPRPHGEESCSEPWANQTECLLEPGDDPVLQVDLRFIQVQARTVEEEVGAGAFRPVESLEVDGSVLVSWDEGVEHEVRASASILDALVDEVVVPFEVPSGVDAEPVSAGGRQVGRIVRRRQPLSGRLRLSAQPAGGPFGALKVRLRVENVTEWHDPAATRDEALLRSLAAVHSLLSLEDASFISCLEPPEWARGDVESCANLHTWPVLVGDEGAKDVMLSSPIILYDYPQIAPESPGELFDGTEIDEILSLRTMALTEEEKREARATDARAAQLIDRVDAMPPEMMDRLHGAIRYLRGTSGGTEASSPSAGTEASTGVPWWDPGRDESVSPESDMVWISGAAVCGGSRVRLRPGARRADAQDLFLEGRLAKVEAVFSDVEDETYLAVTLEDDPGADLQQAHGRFLYFRPDEVEPVGGDS
ncbi:MAG TPA: hypothetical protein VH112_12745 [Acidimicrobiales bacterium]|jgi:hypothetical protein|nr:hypothetical protein [Acidimicrobiales bacterium]